MKKQLFTAVCAFGVLCQLQAKPEIKVSTDAPEHLAKPGQTVTFTAEVTDSGKPLKAGKLSYTLTRDGGKVEKKGSFDLAKGEKIQVSGTLKEPGFLRVEFTLPQEKTPLRKLGAVGFAPEKIRQGKPMPEDFRSFWMDALEKARKTPLDAKMTELKNLATKEARCYAVSFAAPGGRVYGFITLPADGRKVPLMVCIPGAGPGFGPGRALKNGKCAVAYLNVHTYDPMTPGKTLKELYAELKKTGSYPHFNRTDREKYFFYRPIIGICRAIDYFASLPQVDSERIATYGGSQGGMMALTIASLQPRVKAVCANVPAGCDHHAGLQGRGPGWPRLISPKAPGSEVCAQYYDTANFCSFVKVPARVVVGFCDATCPPGSVYAAYNNIPSKDKKIYNRVDMGHAHNEAFAKSVNWLADYLCALK